MKIIDQFTNGPQGEYTGRSWIVLDHRSHCP